MAKIVLSTSDLEKLPNEVRKALQDYVFGKSAAENSETVVTIERTIHDVQFVAVDTISLEASIAFLYGLDILTTIPCIEFLINNNGATKETLAKLAGKNDAKGINGLIGSINRRFKSLFAHPDAHQTVVQYSKREKIYTVDETLRPALRFGLWAIKQDVDWESCKGFAWKDEHGLANTIDFESEKKSENDEEVPITKLMLGSLVLNISSVKSFISKTKLGDSISLGSQDVEEGTAWGTYFFGLANQPNSNFLVPSKHENYWYADDTLLGSTLFLPSDPFLSAFFEPDSDLEKLGKLSEDDFDVVPASEMNRIDITPDFGKFGLYFYSSGRKYKLAWFVGEKETLSFIKNILPFLGPHGINPNSVASKVQKIIQKHASSAGEDHFGHEDFIEALNDALGPCANIAWIGKFDDVIAGEPSSWFIEELRGSFFRELEKTSYEGPILDDDIDAFKDFLQALFQ